MLLSGSDDFSFGVAVGKSTLHQLELITDVLGSMSDADLSAVKRRDETATRLVKTMQAKQNSKPIGFAKRYDKVHQQPIFVLSFHTPPTLSGTASRRHRRQSACWNRCCCTERRTD